ncbi:hypothetical protein C7999DRAFT_18470 [Corynascus novoguineensis]|uniref:Uncharacterized protein n=1 Tax=Corynascus novoguineensis TaxID=1126955 RepID=A0AAN7HK84_9PEZI|nr:hypothetical protein C7999DRAFT_18470 [Corynascus novoguineensis]
MHPSRRPYDVLTKDMVQEKLLELMENYHAVRQLMLSSNQMERLLWKHVQMRAPWANTIPVRILRRLALELAQAAWKNVQNPLRNSNGEELPYCRLAIASVRFSRDIYMYEADSGLWCNDPECRLNFCELRAPAMQADGKPNMDSNGMPVTIPVFPVRNLGKGYGSHSLNKTTVWEKTAETW